jgi:hypothetical protein
MNSPRLKFFIQQISENLDQLSSADLKVAQQHFQDKINLLSKQNRGMGADLLESSILMELGEPHEAAQNYLKAKGIKWRDPLEPSAFRKMMGSRKVVLLTVFVCLAGINHFYFGSFDFNEIKTETLDLVRKIELPKEIAEGLNQHLPAKLKEEVPSETVKTGAASGTYAIVPKGMTTPKIQQLEINFEKGIWILFWKRTAEFKWECNGSEKLEPVADGGTKLVVKVTPSPDLNCRLLIPQNVGLKITGAEGYISVQQPEASLSVELGTGTVAFSPSAKHKYKFHNNFRSGMSSNLESSSDPSAIPIFLSVNNGKIVGESAR